MYISKIKEFFKIINNETIINKKKYIYIMDTTND